MPLTRLPGAGHTGLRVPRPIELEPGHAQTRPRRHAARVRAVWIPFGAEMFGLVATSGLTRCLEAGAVGQHQFLRCPTADLLPDLQAGLFIRVKQPRSRRSRRTAIGREFHFPASPESHLWGRACGKRSRPAGQHFASIRSQSVRRSPRRRPPRCRGTARSTRVWSAQAATAPHAGSLCADRSSVALVRRIECVP